MPENGRSAMEVYSESSRREKALSYSLSPGPEKAAEAESSGVAEIGEEKQEN